MKKYTVFLLVVFCALSLLGCSRKNPALVQFDSSAIICPDCGHPRDKEADFCRICESRKALVDMIISEKERQETQIPEMR